ncbi:MAG: hypothetical protein HEP71_27675 [Roseivirga sp.]|nr:hypothetical protein [Roseivirga sp.]
MVCHRKFWALFFLLTFSLFGFREAIPYEEVVPAIVWDGEEDSGEHDDWGDEEHDAEHGFQGLPTEHHQDIIPQDYLVESKTGSIKKTETEDSSFFVSQNIEIPLDDLLIDQPASATGYTRYNSLCKLTFSLRGPPLFNS